MKLTKSDLKEIVKECLVEIFEESFQPSKKVIQAGPAKSQLTTPQTKQRRPIIENNIKTGNPVMDSIFADTAKNTLPLQVEAETSRQQPVTGRAEKVVASSQPEELFGDDAASKWAALAFNDFSK